MSWARIMVPLAGRHEDARLLSAAAQVAGHFDAEVAGVFAPPDMADLVPWMSDGLVGGVEVAAIEAVKLASTEGDVASRARLDACEASRKSYLALVSPVLPRLALEARLSDVVVFDQDSGCGRSRLAQAFQDLLAAEQRPILVVKQPIDLSVVVVAWNGGKEASRAARTAAPLLQKAGRVVVLTGEEPRTRDVDPQRMVDFLNVRGVKAEAARFQRSGEAAHTILAKAEALGAGLIVSGAFGHPRLREYVLGGATRTLLNASGPSLFLSH